MSKRKSRKAFTARTQPEPAAAPQAFSFGDPTPVMDKRDILDYAECIGNGRWYEPPVSFHGLAKSLRSAVHHSSPIYVKRNILASTFIPHPLLSQQESSKFALNYLVFVMPLPSCAAIHSANRCASKRHRPNSPVKV